MMNEEKVKKWEHITERQRYEIEGMRKAKMKVADIAKMLGKSRSTIYAELKRGTVKQIDSNLKEYEIYYADVAQRDYDSKKSEKGRNLKVGNDMEFIKFVEDKILHEKYSPAATLEALEKCDIKTKVCHRTLYNYIHSGIFLNVTSKDLPYNVSKKTEKERRKIALKNIKGTSIEKRPKEISTRETLGHWEMDTVYSGKGKGTSCLLVLTERKTRNEELYYMESRTQSEVTRILDSIEHEIGYVSFLRKYKTITCDNGVEFLDFKTMERSNVEADRKRTTLYYCHPFASSERASNENQNKLVRRWIPKGTAISDYKEQVPFIQDWINNYPRKLFGGMSSNEYFNTLPLSERSEILIC